MNVQRFVSYLQTLKNSYFPFYLKKTGKDNLFISKNNEKFIYNHDINADENMIVVIIHGWFGNYNSQIIQTYSKFFKQKGFGVIRINLKDHNHTASYNQSVFSFTDTEYIDNIINHIIEINNDKKFVLLGLSFGANILLRLKLNANNLKKIVCSVLITPVFNVETALHDIESDKTLNKILLGQFKEMLLEKQKYFPNLYDFSFIFKQKSCINIIKALLPIWNFNKLQDYFNVCNVNNINITNLTYPTLIVICKNDPIILHSNIDYLLPSILSNKNITLQIEKYGGHSLFYKKSLDFIINLVLKH